jgi:hypothetical protein
MSRTLHAGWTKVRTVRLNIRVLPLSPWQGLGVLAASAAGAFLLGGLALRLRDA